MRFGGAEGPQTAQRVPEAQREEGNHLSSLTEEGGKVGAGLTTCWDPL